MFIVKNMAIVTRTVTGTIKDPQNQNLTGKEITFIPLSHFGSGDIVIPSLKQNIELDNNSAFSVNLTTLDDAGAGVVYTCRLPSGELFQFVLEAGTPITLNELRSQAVINSTNENVTAVIEELVEALMDDYAPISHTHTPANISETVVIQNGNYQLTINDIGKLFVKNGGANSTLTLPTTGLVAGQTKFFFTNLTDSFLTIASNSTIYGYDVANASLLTRIPGSSCEVIYLGVSIGWLLRKQTGEWA